MSHRVFRDLQKVFKRHACTVEKFEVSGRNMLKVWLLAPDGVTRQMLAFSNETGSSTKYQQGNEQMVKRFALAHPAPTVHSVAPVERLKTLITPPLHQRAAAIEVLRVSPPAPMPPDAVVKNGVAYAPQPHTEEKPAMTPAPAPTPAPGAQEKRLDRKQFHQLTKWIAQNVPQGLETTVALLAKEASQHLQFAIAESTVKEALDLEEIKLAEPKRPEVPTDRTWAVAMVLKNLMVELKMDPPEVLLAICERRKVK